MRAIGVQFRAGGRDKDRVQDALRVQGDSEEVEAELLGAQATLDLAKLKLDSIKITAPIDGVISRLFQREGDFVEAGKTELARIVAADVLFADAHIKEATAQRLERARVNGNNGPSGSIRVAVRDEVDFPRSGKIEFVGLEVNPADESVLLRLLIPNRDGTLRPGLSARVRITLGPPRETLLVPEATIAAEEGRLWVYVLNAKNVVERRYIRVGQLYTAGRAIKEGLKADDRVITDDSGRDLLGKGPIPASSIDRSDEPPDPAEKPSTR